MADYAQLVDMAVKAVGFLSKEWPDIVENVDDAKEVALGLVAQWKGEEVTEEEQATLEAEVDKTYADFMKPLPPEGQTE